MNRWQKRMETWREILFTRLEKELKESYKDAVLCLAAQSCPTLCDPMDYSPPGSSVHGILQARILEWVAISYSRGSSQTQRLNQVLPHCRQILYQLSHQGSPWILEWVACPFSRGSFWPRNWFGVFCIAAGFFTSWATREAPWMLQQSKLCVICFSSHAKLNVYSVY